TIKLAGALSAQPSPPLEKPEDEKDPFEKVKDDELKDRGRRMHHFATRLEKAGLGETYEAAHAAMAVRAIQVIAERQEMLERGAIAKLPPASQAAADNSYVDTAVKLCKGLEAAVAKYNLSSDPQEQQILKIWQR